MIAGDAPGALLAALRQAGLHPRARRDRPLDPAREFGIRARHWLQAATLARLGGWRLSSLWAEERGTSMLLTILIECGGSYLALRTRARAPAPSLPSLARVWPAADRLERHARDLLGIEFEDHPDPRRWTRHRAWHAGQHPLREAFPAAGLAAGTTPCDAGFPYREAQGAGVHEIPVGPVHAGIIEPGHFRFQAVGEEVLGLEVRLGYLHKGVEKIAVGRDAAGLARLAARVSGDTAVGHAWAACMAMERAARCVVPARALALRAVLAERERVINHLWDIAAICNDVGFPFAYYQFGRVVEDWRRLNGELFGNRLLMDTVVPGGVSVDVDTHAVQRLAAQGAAGRRELDELWSILQDKDSLHERLASTGVLAPHDARDLGVLGFVGRASGVDFDVRRDAPYAPYDGLDVSAPCLPHGDVAARTRIRHDEVLVSLALIERLLAELPPGPVAGALVMPRNGAEGIGIVDGWRGELVAHVRFAGDGRVSRYFPRDPSWLSWPALERLIHGNIVPDFPVCNKSINGSYSGHDL